MTTLYQILPLSAVLLFILATVSVAFRQEPDWRILALVALAFLGWTLYAVVSEGLAGFWYEHIRNAWTNQIWFDLLIALAIAWTLVLPRARAVGMQSWMWLLLIFLTGCIGLAAMFARCRYLESRTLA